MAYKFTIPTLRYPTPPAGEYIAEVKTLSTKDKDGAKLVSRNGDPKLALGLILVSKEGNLYETTEFVTLPTLDENGDPVQETGVYLLRLLSEVLRALGHNMTTGEAFEINSSAFIGKTAKVTIEIREHNGKHYPQVKRWDFAPTRVKTADDDEIPF